MLTAIFSVRNDEWPWFQPYEKAASDELEESISYDELQLGPVEKRPKLESRAYRTSGVSWR